MELVLIAAVAANGVIGRDGTLPWHLPEDLAHFKRTTMGHPVIMGRINFEDVLDTLGTPMPGRTNIVLTRRDWSFPPEVIQAPDVDTAIHAAKDTGADVAFVAGGATVYEAMLPCVDRMILTELEDVYSGDVYFPEWNRAAWQERSRERHDGFDIVEYERITDCA